MEFEIPERGFSVTINIASALLSAFQRVSFLATQRSTIKMPDEFVKDSEVLQSSEATGTRTPESPTLRTIPSQKNTVLISHGRPPW